MKQFIKNRKNQNISVLIEEIPDAKGLAFVMHGLGGFKEQDHVATFAETFKENNYTVVRFDAADSIGESEGQMENATATNYYEDLEDVITWSKQQTWYQEPFILAGHSLGGGCVLLYAENYPEKVKALAPIATVISGKLQYETHPPEVLAEWEKTGYRLSESKSKPGVIRKISWKLMEDMLKYDLLEKVQKLTMPVLMIVGDQDTSTLPEHQKILYEKLPGLKELHIIKDAPHTYRETQHLAEIKQIFNNWLLNLK